MKTEFLFFWIAVGMYGLSTFSYVFGLIAKQDKLFMIGLYSALIGFIPHTLAIALRWSAAACDHPLYHTSESLTLGIIHGGAAFSDFPVQSSKQYARWEFWLCPSFCFLGWAGTLMKEVRDYNCPALQSDWLWVHITGASIGFASVLIAAGSRADVPFERKRNTGIYEKLPDLASHGYVLAIALSQADLSCTA